MIFVVLDPVDNLHVGCKQVLHEYGSCTFQAYQYSIYPMGLHRMRCQASPVFVLQFAFSNKKRGGLGMRLCDGTESIDLTSNTGNTHCVRFQLHSWTKHHSYMTACINRFTFSQAKQEVLQLHWLFKHTVLALYHKGLLLLH